MIHRFKIKGSTSPNSLVVFFHSVPIRMPDSLFGDSDSEDDPRAERTSNASVSDDLPLEFHSTTLREADDGLSESTGGSQDTIGTYTVSVSSGC